MPVMQPHLHVLAIVKAKGSVDRSARMGLLVSSISFSIWDMGARHVQTFLPIMEEGGRAEVGLPACE